MADEQATTEKQGGKDAKKMVLLIAGLLVIEAAAFLGGITFLGGGPDEASAEGVLLDPETAELEKIVEVTVLDTKLANAKTGVTYLYDTEIYVQVKKRHSENVAAELEQFSNEIKSELNAIWRTSDPRHFNEPKLESLTRRVYALLHERFGSDAETEEPILVKAVIVMGTGFRVDS